MILRNWDDSIYSAADLVKGLDARLKLERLDICPAHYRSQFSASPPEISQVMEQVACWADLSAQLGSLGLAEKEQSFLHVLWSARAGLYDYFPYLFLDAFPSTDPQSVRDLAASARLCYTAIVLTDRLTDGVYASKARLLLEVNRMYTGATRLLTRLFSSTAPFWEYFDRCFQEQIHALALESEHHFHTLSPYPFKEMREIAQGKAALGKYVITGLGMLTGDVAPVEPLLTSYELYYTGYQLFDDVCDWKEDYRREIYSYLITQAVEHFRAERGELAGRPTLIELGELIGTDLGVEHLRQADAYFAQATDALGAYPCHLWRGMIRETRARCQSLAADLQEIAEQQFCRQRQYWLKPISFKPSDSANDDDAIEREAAEHSAIAFLLHNQQADGHWKDFWGVPGASTEWVTGYVGLALTNYLAECRPSLETARNWLLSNRRTTGGWGYNAKVSADADSTAYCLLFLHALGTETWAMHQDLELLLAHQDLQDGGFRTYLPTALPNRSGTGWCLSEPSVTAAAAWLLSQLPSQANVMAVKRAIAFLVAQQSEEGYWPTYWWNDTVYSTAIAVQALVAIWNCPQWSGSQDQRVLDKASAWFIGTQRPDGAWSGDLSIQAGQPFATALALRALLMIGGGNPRIARAIHDAMIWLVASQLVDGSWRSYPILQIPEPEVLNPAQIRALQAAKLEMAEDSRRVFTTATVLNALTCVSDNLCQRAKFASLFIEG